MKNKILIVTVIFALMISIFPGAVLAKENNTNIKPRVQYKHIKEKFSKKLKKPTKAEIKEVGSDLEYYKQDVLELIDEMYYKSYENEYINSVKTTLDSFTDEFSNAVNEATSVDDIVTIISLGGGWYQLEYSDYVVENLYTMEYLTSWDKQVVANDKDLSNIKQDLKVAVNNEFECYTSDKYNDYYLSIIEGVKQNLIKDLDNITNVKTLAGIVGKVDLEVNSNLYGDIHLDYSDGIYSSCGEYDDSDYYYGDDEDDDYYYEDFIKDMGMTYVPSVVVGLKAYTKSELNDLKKFTTFYLDTYVNKELQLSTDATNIDEAKAIANTAIQKINSSYNANEIVTLYENAYIEIDKVTGVEFKNLTTSTSYRIANKIKKLKYTYLDKKVYSDGGISKNSDILYYAETTIENTFKDIEIPSDFEVKLEKVLKKTPTYAQELKSLKVKVLKELNSYKNNKKYNQTKVNTILTQATKKINASTDIDEVWNLYYDYVEKLDKTINKYLITTKKVGKGTITKSKTITYGNSFTVKMTPNKGYKIKSVYVDGKKKKITTKYTFKNVTKKHTIKVVFEKK